MRAFVGRWWPLPVAVAVVLALQMPLYNNRYDVGGHAGEHLASGSFVFFATVVAGLLLWTTPSALRSPIVLGGLAVWLAGGVAMLIGNVRVVDALIESGQSHTGTETVIHSGAVEDAHWLANNAGYIGIVGALVVIVGLHRSGLISNRMGVITGILSVIFPPWVLPGVGVVIVTIARCIARERDARRVEEVPA